LTVIPASFMIACGSKTVTSDKVYTYRQ
jgi:hypothetical protein